MLRSVISYWRSRHYWRARSTNSIKIDQLKIVALHYSHSGINASNYNDDDGDGDAAASAD